MSEPISSYKIVLFFLTLLCTCQNSLHSVITFEPYMVGKALNKRRNENTGHQKLKKWLRMPPKSMRAGITTHISKLLPHFISSLQSGGPFTNGSGAMQRTEVQSGDLRVPE